MDDQRLHKAIERCVKEALEEDLGERGDLTTRYAIPETARSSARILARADGVVAGLTVAAAVFTRLDSQTRFESLQQDGEAVRPGDVVARVEGGTAALLTAERTALNFLQHLSGIATLTRRYIEAIRGTGARLVDTRKTTPGLRVLEKYAVRVGGGDNHRFGLFDMVLLKENHIGAAGGLQAAVERCREGLQRERIDCQIEVEVRSLAELEEALRLPVDRILLDNFGLEEVRQAVERAGGRIPLEVSGGVNLKNIRALAETGVNYISVGALTHSAPALDLSMLIES